MNADGSPKYAALMTIAVTALVAALLWLLPDESRRSRSLQSEGAIKNPSSQAAVGPRAGSVANRHVLLIGLDGCSYDLVQRWVAQGELPNLASLISTSASGHLSSLAVPRAPGKSPAISSPVVWTTIATGKLPDRHGVWDFGQPFPDDLYASMAGDRAEILLPVTLATALRIRIQCRQPKGAPAADVQAFVNGREIGQGTVSARPSELQLIVPAELISAQRNVLEIRSSSVGLGCRAVAIEDVDGDFLSVVDTLRNADSFASGWKLPDTTARPLLQTAHRKARAFWDILTERGGSSALVGWWGTWPAYRINGVMLSSHLGIRGKKTLATRDYREVLRGIPYLTYPDSYLAHILDRGLVPVDASQAFKRTIVELGGCRIAEGSVSAETIEDVFTQDSFYHNLARDILRSPPSYNVVSVYCEGTDAISHKFYDFMSGRRSGRDKWIECADDGKLSTVVENYYRFADGMIGDLLDAAGSAYDTIMIVTDHGFDERGHADNGWILMRGPGIKRIVLRRASVRDVTPTLLYMFGLPIGEDMDGEPILSAFTAEYRQAHPVTTTRTYETTPFELPAVASPLEKEMAERLRSLGYIE